MFVRGWGSRHGLESLPVSPKIVQLLAELSLIEDEETHGNHWRRFTPDAAYPAGSSSRRSTPRRGRDRHLSCRYVSRATRRTGGSLRLCGRRRDRSRQSLHRRTPFALHPRPDTVHGRDLLSERWRLVDVDARGARHAVPRSPAMSDIIIMLFSARR